jgi:hypothetical protein
MSRVPSEREIVIVNNKTESWYIPTGTSIPPLVYICTHNKKRNGIFNVSLSKTDFEDFCIWIQDNIPPLNESLLSLIPPPRRPFARGPTPNDFTGRKPEGTLPCPASILC